MTSSTAAEVSLPWRCGAASSFEPLEKNSGAPHSSVSTCEASLHTTAWYDWHSAASAMELAAVPLKTKNTSASASNSVRSRSQTWCVASSLPYEAAKPSLAPAKAASASGHTPAVLSLANWMK